MLVSTDANMNVTASYIDGGASTSVFKRYDYTAYGEVLCYDSSWQASTPWPTWCQPLFCGYLYDAETGLYQVRNRYLLPPLGRWTTRDPLNQNQPAGGYQDGMSLYGYAGSAPSDGVDPLGQREVRVNIGNRDQWAIDERVGRTPVGIMENLLAIALPWPEANEGSGKRYEGTAYVVRLSAETEVACGKWLYGSRWPEEPPFFSDRFARCGISAKFRMRAKCFINAYDSYYTTAGWVFDLTYAWLSDADLEYTKNPCFAKSALLDTDMRDRDIAWEDVKGAILEKCQDEARAVSIGGLTFGYTWQGVEWQVVQGRERSYRDDGTYELGDWRYIEHRNLLWDEPSVPFAGYRWRKEERQ